MHHPARVICNQYIFNTYLLHFYCCWFFSSACLLIFIIFSRGVVSRQNRKRLKQILFFAVPLYATLLFLFCFKLLLLLLMLLYYLTLVFPLFTWRFRCCCCTLHFILVFQRYCPLLFSMLCLWTERNFTEMKFFMGNRFLVHFRSQKYCEKFLTNTDCSI